MNLKTHIHENILPRVQKPSRYLGTELNAIHKNPDDVSVRFCLAFPDLYDLGLSNLGLLILYSVINSRPDVWCERAYAPGLDMEALLRAENLPLFSVESKTPLADFDVLGFTLQYELSYTNILNMLDMGGIPVLSAERTDAHPIIVAGGPCVFNPEPLADFVDAFAIGDGEDVVLDMVDAIQRTKGLPRQAKLEAMAAIPGVYVPALFPMKTIEGGWIVPDLDKAAPIKKRLVPDLNEAAFPTNYIVPYTEQVHDRVSLEVLRGCTQSCRFCQAGMTTRPVRERTLEKLDQLLNETMANTGYEEFALSSLSTCDYSQVKSLVAQSVTTAMQRGASVSLPSLRSDSFSVDLSDMVRTIRQTGLTFAPEAATNRMRAVINKWIPDDDLLAMTKDVYARGWDTVKMYFMIGLPTETDEDVAAIGHLSVKVLRSGRAVNRRARVNMGVSTFVPKPHTPFQWDRQIGIEETFHKHRILRGILGKDGPKFGKHDAPTSYLEGVMSRADRRVCRLLLLAWQKGCRFDAWGEHFRWDVWQEALAEWGPNADDYLAEIPVERALPWDHIDVLVTKQYHLDEYNLSRENRLTPDCRYTKCNDCGVIHDEVKACATMLKTSREGIKIERNWKRPAHLGGARHGTPTPLPPGGVGGGQHLLEEPSVSRVAPSQPPPEGEGPDFHAGGPRLEHPVPPLPLGERGLGGEGYPAPAPLLPKEGRGEVVGGQTPIFGQEGSKNALERKGQGGAPVTPIIAEEPPADYVKPPAPEAVCRLALTVAKYGTLRFLSHLELASVFQRAMRRANLPIAMSQGFHPHPRLSFATPLPTGLESYGELADVTLTAEITPEEFVRRYNAVSPEGLEVLSARVMPLDGASIQAQVIAGDYEAYVPYETLSEADVRAALAAFEAVETYPVRRNGKNGIKTVDIRPMAESISVTPNGHGTIVAMRLVDKPGAKGRPEEILAALVGDAKTTCRVRKTATILQAKAKGEGRENAAGADPPLGVSIEEDVPAAMAG